MPIDLKMNLYQWIRCPFGTRYLNLRQFHFFQGEVELSITVLDEDIEAERSASRVLTDVQAYHHPEVLINFACQSAHVIPLYLSNNTDELSSITWMIAKDNPSTQTFTPAFYILLRSLTIPQSSVCYLIKKRYSKLLLSTIYVHIYRIISNPCSMVILELRYEMCCEIQSFNIKEKRIKCRVAFYGR